VHFYRCIISQLVDQQQWDDWYGRLAHEESCVSYQTPWGEIADACRRVLAWQSRAYPIAAKIIDIAEQPDMYRDRPGVVWQGYRELNVDG